MYLVLGDYGVSCAQRALLEGCLIQTFFFCQIVFILVKGLMVGAFVSIWINIWTFLSFFVAHVLLLWNCSLLFQSPTDGKLVFTYCFIIYIYSFCKALSSHYWVSYCVGKIPLSFPCVRVIILEKIWPINFLSFLVFYLNVFPMTSGSICPRSFWASSGSSPAQLFSSLLPRFSPQINLDSHPVLSGLPSLLLLT